MLSNRRGMGIRLAGVAFLFMIATGQASSGGCAGPPREEVLGTVAADAAAPAPEPVTEPEAAGSQPAQGATSSLALGKYGCTSSRYDSSSGFYEYTPRGSVVLSADGSYHYLGLETPSPGRYSYDSTSGKITFRSGYLDHGEATPMDDRLDRYFLVFPTIPGGRWTCGLADE